MRSFDRSQRLIRYRKSDRSTWPGMAFILESLLLLLFVSASLAVLMSLFVQADLLGKENAERSEAILVASNVAEMFAQNPENLPATFEQDGYQVMCDTESQTTDAGTLILAHIAVAFESNQLYELTTAAYQSNHAAKGSIEAVESIAADTAAEGADGEGLSGAAESATDGEGSPEAVEGATGDETAASEEAPAGNEMADEAQEEVIE